MSWWEALILGLVQGLTEFLPVSSSGHLEIGQALLGTASEENLTFAIVVHAATVMSTLFILWKEVAQLFKGTFTTTKWNEDKNYVAMILVSMIPVFVVGMFFKEQVESLFGSGLKVVGICLCITAVLLYFSEWLSKRRVGEGHEVGYKDAIIIGLAQAVAVLPGLSRSGTTIATGLLCGVKKESVTKFSFLMVLIPILGEAFLELLDLLSGEVVSSLGLVPMLVGFVAAFASGCLACKFMINIVRKQKLIYFAIPFHKQRLRNSQPLFLYIRILSSKCYRMIAGGASKSCYITKKNTTRLGGLSFLVAEAGLEPTPCCGARQALRPSKRSCALPTAATRSGRSSRPRRRSPRSPPGTRRSPQILLHNHKKTATFR